VQLSDGDVAEIKPTQIAHFGANALFQPHSEEFNIVRNVVSHTEEDGRMFELLQMVLLGGNDSTAANGS
jgi:hypothetical protein